jgi:crotonobetainyl-CoA:carnitine CoA-transferase CaiB-like acyl-CoA transferase
MDDLEGVVVVSVEQAVAAPYASAMLADAGARVIKVERPEGDFARTYDTDVLGQSAYFVWLNRGKESVCLDLSSGADRNVLAGLAGHADVFIQNLRPGVLARIGLGAAALRAASPGLITCDISGFGGSGPCASRKAYDLIIQAEVGLCSITGTVDEPARVGISVCDIAAGAAAHAAILQALFVRTRSGRGRCIEVSLFDSLAQWMTVPILQHMYGGRDVGRAGVSHPTIAPYGAFVCKGGRRIILAVQNDREWRAFAGRFLGRADLVSDPRFKTNAARVSNRPELDGLIAERFVSMTTAQAVEALDGAGIAYGCLNDLSEVVAHPHLRLIGVSTPAGEVRIVAPAAILSDTASRERAIPRLGEHTDAVRASCPAPGVGSSGLTG